MRRLVVEYRVCSQLFSSTNFFNVFNAFPLSNDSRAMATHSSIGLAGSMACMAKEALISTQSVWALVALFSSTLWKIFDASSGKANAQFLEHVGIKAHLRQIGDS